MLIPSITAFEQEAVATNFHHLAFTHTLSRVTLQATRTMSSDEEEFEFGGEEGEAEEEEEEADDGEEEEEAEDDDDEEEEAEEEDDGEEVQSTRGRKRKSISYAEDGDDDDDEDESSDDDIPLAQLKSPKKKAKPSPKKKAPAKKKAAPKKKAPAKSEPKKSDDYNTMAAAIFGTECIKGKLIQKLLCRWWYAIEWPTDVPDRAPKNYDAMDGIPGVFVCTSGGNVGKIKDVRDMENKPSFANFLSKDASELKDLLITAVEAQKEQLIEAEGEGTPTEKELKEMLKWAKKINGDKADKEATRVLKKAGMSQ